MIKGDNKPQRLAWNEVPSDAGALESLLRNEQGDLSAEEEKLYQQPTRWQRFFANRHSGVPNLEKGVVIESKMNKDVPYF